MELWRRRVNEALDALLAARVAESCVQKQLHAQHVYGAAHDAEKLRLQWRETSEAARSARVRVEAVLWE